MKANLFLFLLSALLLASGCLLRTEPSLPAMPLSELNLQASDLEPGSTMVREGPLAFAGQDALAGASNLSPVHTYYRQFELSSAAPAQALPLQVISVVLDCTEVPLARQLAQPSRICPPAPASPLCSRVYSIPDAGDEAYLFEDFKYANLASSGDRYYIWLGVVRRGQYLLEVNLVFRPDSDSTPASQRAAAIEKMKALSDRFTQRLAAARGAG